MADRDKDDRVIYSGKIARHVRDKFRGRCAIAGVNMEDKVEELMNDWSEAEIDRERAEFLRNIKSD